MSGVLPVALGSATKLIGLIMLSTKEYVAVAQLHEPVDEARLREVIKEFIGRIYQRPPLRSSVKRALRVKTVYGIELLEYEFPYALLLIRCEHGTYVRKLIHDIGLILGVGAHMRELRRVRTGPFKEDSTLVTMHELSEAVYLYRSENDDSALRKTILPAEYIVSHMRKVVVVDGAVSAISHGADLAIPGISMIHENIRRGERVAIFSLKGEIVAIGRTLMSTEEVLERRKGIAVKTRRVIMKRDTYPRSWRRKQSK